MNIESASDLTLTSDPSWLINQAQQSVIRDSPPLFSARLPSPTQTTNRYVLGLSQSLRYCQMVDIHLYRRRSQRCRHHLVRHYLPPRPRRFNCYHAHCFVLDHRPYPPGHVDLSSRWRISASAEGFDSLSHRCIHRSCLLHRLSPTRA